MNYSNASIERDLEQALTHHQAGRLVEARRVYQTILQADPRHPAANHNLGVLAMAEDRIDEALHHLKQAVEADPTVVEAWIGYVEALVRAGRHGSARDVLKLARQRGLESPQFMLLEGRLAAEIPLPPIAAASFAQSPRTRRSAVSPDPTLAATVEALIGERRFVDAQAKAMQLLRRYPEHSSGWKCLGAALRGQGQNLPALRALARAVEFDAGDAYTRNELGHALSAAGRHSEAEASYLAALEIDPADADIHNNLGILAMDTHRIAEAEKRFREAMRLQPNAAGPHNSLGLLYEKTGRLAEANACFRVALQIAPEFSDALNNLAMNLLRTGGLDEAEQLFRRLLSGRPDFLLAYSNLLFTMNYSARHSVRDSLAEARRYGAVVAALASRPYAAWAAPPSSRRLRVGLVSGDLEQHPVGYFLDGLFGHLDKRRLELFAYPTHALADELTLRLRSHVTEWRPLVGLNDEDAARLIHSDGIDVLIDLSGHTAQNRLPVFAWKPAPVQVSWLGYFATTGVAEIDYLLADAVSVPPQHHDHFTETIWYLPETRLCFTPPPDAPQVAPLPALANGFITFGSFQNLPKLNDSVLGLWGRILNALPEASLRVQSTRLIDARVRESLSRRLQHAGIPPERVSLHGPMTRHDYLAAHGEVDLILDSFPFPGGTTTCEALWMGVPTITLVGDRLIARQGASLLAAAGLADWIADTPADYFDKAITFARNLPTLAGLRQSLRDQVSRAPLFDTERFARNLENALCQMWQRRRSARQIADPDARGRR